MTENIIWESTSGIKAHKALEQVGLSTGRRERKKLLDKGIPVISRQGNKIIKQQQNHDDIILQENIKPFAKIKKGVYGCIRQD